MAQHHLTIEYPESLLAALSLSREDFEREARLALAAKLFEMKRVSSGVAARLAGVDRATFLLSLHRFGVAAIDLDDRELMDELRNA